MSNASRLSEKWVPLLTLTVHTKSRKVQVNAAATPGEIRRWSGWKVVDKEIEGRVDKQQKGTEQDAVEWREYTIQSRLRGVAGDGFRGRTRT